MIIHHEGLIIFFLGNDCLFRCIVMTPFLALTLQAETFVWGNTASAHSQSVAKAKYEFLFGKSEEKSPDTSKFLPTLSCR